jgi:hypothetical protein
MSENLLATYRLLLQDNTTRMRYMKGRRKSDFTDIDRFRHFETLDAVFH